jgi:putative transposase
MVNHPSEYRWSSFNVNALGESSDLLTPHKSWRALGDGHTDRLIAYQHVIEVALEQPQIDEIRHGVQKGLPTGSDRFKQQIEEALSIKLSDGKRGRPKKANVTV